MGLFKVVGGVVKGTATVVGGVAKGTALVAEGVIKGSMVLAEVLSEDKQKKETNNFSITHNKKMFLKILTSQKQRLLGRELLHRQCPKRQ